MRRDFASVTAEELREAEVKNDTDELARLLARACYRGQEEIIKDMLRMYGDVVDPNGHVDLLVTWLLTPATMATVDGGPSNALAILKLLIASGADPNRQCGLGWTPLHHAAKAGNVELVNYLMDHNHAMYFNAKYFILMCEKERCGKMAQLTSELLQLILNQVMKGVSLKEPPPATARSAPPRH